MSARASLAMPIPTPTEMLRALVGAPSVSSTDAARDQGNLPVVHHLANWLEDLRFQVELLPLPNKPDKANLVARRDGGSGDAGLVLAGHTDTVPCDEALWHVDPFALTERGDRLYGLGACDMKGFFPLALAAAAEHRDAKLRKPLTVVATADEESCMDGARALAAAGVPKAAAAVIGEPTGMVPVRAHKGVAMLSIAVQGSSGHSSNPALGDNALEAMHRVIAALLRLRAEWAARHVDASFAVAVPTLNLGCLHAGDNPNRICGHAELQIDLRLLPGMDTAAVVEEVRERAQAAGEGTPVAVRAMFEPIEPYQTAADGALVRTLEALSGRAAATVAFGTEAPFFQALGMETVVFGPGAIDQAHQPDEFVDRAQFQPMRDALGALITRYCR